MKKTQQTGKQAAHRLNDEITGLKEVRLNGLEGDSLGIVSLKEALTIAEEAGVDLVEISPNAEPPVCRVMDYGKYLFEKAKAAKEQKKKQKQVQVKEIKLRPGTDVGDYQVKLRNLSRFLEEGNKVKVTIRFRGREMAHKDNGFAICNKLLEEVENAEWESKPSFAGNRLIGVLKRAK